MTEITKKCIQIIKEGHWQGKGIAKLPLRERLDRILRGKAVLTESLSSHLSELTVPYAVVGGHAVVLHGHPRTTVDIDIMVNPADLDQAVADLRLTDQSQNTVGGISGLKGDIPVDVLAPDEPWAGDAISTAVSTDGVRVVSKPYLVLLKMWSARGGQELMDVAYMLKLMSPEELHATSRLIKKYGRRLGIEAEDYEQVLELSRLDL